jgi:murein DD-endopeptidase MepM/ murein hydrolase activator NlpD
MWDYYLEIIMYKITYQLSIIIFLFLYFGVLTKAKSIEGDNNIQKDSISINTTTYTNLKNRLYSHSFTSNSAIFVVDPTDGSTTLLGYSGIYGITDIAFSIHNILFGITFNDLIYIDPYTGQGERIGSIGFNDLNALTTSPEGIIYSAGYTDGKFVRIDENTGKGTLIGYYGPGLTSSGDLDFANNGELLSTVKRSGFMNDWLASIDPMTGTAALIGDTGFVDIWGISFKDDILYGVTYSGQLITINPTTGAGHLVGSSPGIYHGGLTTTPKVPLLDLPFSYTNFSQSAQGNVGLNPGRINSWFDHNLPSPYNEFDDNLLPWIGYPEIPGHLRNCTLGISCYGNHDGIDFSPLVAGVAGEDIFAAAPGKVVDVVNNCETGERWCGGGYGNQVRIDHEDGYSTFYTHLQDVFVEVGDELDNTNFRSEPIGSMGYTGNVWGQSGVHLHFGVYFDPTNAWSRSSVLDPYGWWDSEEVDPWTNSAGDSSVAMWKRPILNQFVGTSSSPEFSINTPSEQAQLTFPTGVFSADTLVQILDIPALPASSAQLRSAGTSFWVRLLNYPTNTMIGEKTISFFTNDLPKPINVKANYDLESIRHLDVTTLALYRWEDQTQLWAILPSVVDTSNNIVEAQSSLPGKFDIQGELLCPADTAEPNNTSYHAQLVKKGEIVGVINYLNDEDWYWIEAKAGAVYTIEITRLGVNVDPYVELYDFSGGNLVSTDDDSGIGKGFRLSWVADDNQTYFIRVLSNEGSAYGCDATYTFNLSIEYNINLPIVIK